MPRWLVQAVVVIALIVGGIAYINLTRVHIPEACGAGENALGEEAYDLAIDNFLDCLDAGDLPPEILSRVYHALGNAYIAKEDYRQAIQDYSEAIRHDPGNGWSYNNRCWSYGHLRRGEEALADCNEALRLLPDQPEILDSRALAFWVLGDTGSARRDLDRARRFQPSFPAADQRLREFEGFF